MNRHATLLVVAALAGCASEAPRPQPTRTRLPLSSDGRGYHFVDARQTIDLVKESEDSWAVASCKSAAGSPDEPDPATLDFLSLELDAKVRAKDGEHEHPLRRSVREGDHRDGTGDGTGDVAL